MYRRFAKYTRVALLVAGGAILLSACKKEITEAKGSRYDALMTEYSENRTIIASENGVKQYQFFTPLLEGYTAGTEPYREFRKGIRMETFKKDSTGEIDVTLTANYAIYYEKRKLWEAKGNVVVRKFDGKELYTEQLFWNDITNKIYSNVDSKIVEPDGETFVSGFESDEEFRYWSAREMDGRMQMEFKPTQPDTTQLNPASTAVERESVEQPDPDFEQRGSDPRIVKRPDYRKPQLGEGAENREREKARRDSIRRLRQEQARRKGGVGIQPNLDAPFADSIRLNRSIPEARPLNPEINNK